MPGHRAPPSKTRRCRLVSPLMRLRIVDARLVAARRQPPGSTWSRPGSGVYLVLTGGGRRRNPRKSIASRIAYVIMQFGYNYAVETSKYAA